MNKKEILKEYLRKYGELEALNNIAIIFQELSQEWKDSGNKPVGYALSDAATAIAEVSANLRDAEEKHLETVGLSNPTELERSKMELEYRTLMRYFQVTPFTELRKEYDANTKELMSKVKRLDYLKRHLTKPNDKENK